MDAEEYLSLPPWQKFSKYGMIPYKMLLHLALLSLVTTQCVLSNREMSSYSQSIWNSVPNIFFRPGATSSETTTALSKYEYYLFTQNQTIADSNLLISSYFSFSEVSLGKISIYSAESFSNRAMVDVNPLPPPKVIVKKSSGVTRSYTVMNASDPTWPLSSNSPLIHDVAYLRSFFNELMTMTFEFYIKSSGTSDDSAWSTSKHLCFLWKLTFTYDLRSMGQILVSYFPVVSSRCEKLKQDTYIYVASVFVLILGIIYQILMLRAFGKQLIILHNITRLKAEVGESLDMDGNRQIIKRGSDTSAGFLPIWNTNVSMKTLTQQSQDRRGFTENKNIDEVKDDDENKSDNDDSGEGDCFAEVGPQTTKTLLHLPGKNSDVTVKREEFHNNESSRIRNYSDDSLALSSSNTIGVELNVLKTALKSLSYKDILSVLNVWILSSSTGNIFTLIYSSSVVFTMDDVSTEKYERVFLGLSAFFLWFTVLQYVEYYPRYYVVIQMLKTTTPQISQFLFGVLPLFFGYSFLGMVIFSESIDRFSNLQYTMRTLFALVNGDIIYDTFLSVASCGLAAQLYVYIYILIFSYVVLMSVIAIVEESYFKAQNNLRELDQKKNSSPTLSTDPILLGNGSHRSAWIDQEANTLSMGSSISVTDRELFAEQTSRRNISHDGKRGLRKK